MLAEIAANAPFLGEMLATTAMRDVQAAQYAQQKQQATDDTKGTILRSLETFRKANPVLAARLKPVKFAEGTSGIAFFPDTQTIGFDVEQMLADAVKAQDQGVLTPDQIAARVETLLDEEVQHLADRMAAINIFKESVAGMPQLAQDALLNGAPISSITDPAEIAAINAALGVNSPFSAEYAAVQAEFQATNPDYTPPTSIFNAWSESYYFNLAREFSAENLAATRKAYGPTFDELDDQGKVQEGIRMLSQIGRSKFGEITESLYRHVKATVEALKKLLTNPPPNLKRHLDAMERVLAELGIAKEAAPPPDTGAAPAPTAAAPAARPLSAAPAASPTSKNSKVQHTNINYSMEMIPGANTGHPMAALINAPYEVKEQYHREVTNAFLEPGTGIDLLADAFGLAGGMTSGLVSQSVYVNSAGQIEFNPAAQVPLQAKASTEVGKYGKSSPVDYTAKKGDTVSKLVAALNGSGKDAAAIEAQLRKLNPNLLPDNPKEKLAEGAELRLPSTVFDRVKAYSVAHGILQQQEAVAGFLPVLDDSIPLEQRNGIIVDVGRPLESMELDQLLNLVQARFGSVNNLGYFANSKGFSLVNFGVSPEGNAAFHKLVVDIENDTLLGGIFTDAGYFATHEDFSIYIERGDGSRAGSADNGYVNSLQATGYGAEFERVRQRIEPRLAEVNRLWQVRLRLAQERLTLGVTAAWESALQETGGRPNASRQPLSVTPTVAIRAGMTPEQIREDAYKAVAAGEKSEGRVPASERMQQTTARAKLALESLDPNELAMTGISVSGVAPEKFATVTDFQSYLEKNLGGIVGEMTASNLRPDQKEALVAALNDMVVGRLVKDGSGADWYNTAVQVAMAITHQIHPELKTDFDTERLYKALVAVTSQGQRVDHNWHYADLVYRYWKDSAKAEGSKQRLPDIISFGGKSNEQITGNLVQIQKLIDKHGLAGAMDILDQPMTVKNIDQMVWDMIPETDGKTAVSGEQKDALLYGAMMLGPKIGSFYGNLNFRFDTVTMDLWFMRTMQRLLGRPFGISLGSPAKGKVYSGQQVTWGGLRGQLQRLQFDLESKQALAAKGVGIKELKASVRAAEKEFEKASIKAREAVKGAEKTIAQTAQRIAQDALYAARIKLAESTFGALERKALKEIYSFMKLTDKQVSDRRNELVERLTNVADYSSAVHADFVRHGYRKEFKNEHNRAAKNVDDALTGGREAPGSGSERNAIREIIEALQTRLLSQGLDLAHADVQAVLWYAEKDLYSAFGVADNAEGQDYGYSAAVLAAKIANGEDIKRGGSVGDSTNPEDVLRVKNAAKETEADDGGDITAEAPERMVAAAPASAPDVPGTIDQFYDLETKQEISTGQPVTFNYARNNTPAYRAGKTFGQDIEPAGRFLTPVSDEAMNRIPSLEYGSITFERPLVLEWTGYGDDGWKARLSEAFGNKKGQALSKAIANAGFDGIITVTPTRGGQFATESVDLSMWKAAPGLQGAPAATATTLDAPVSDGFYSALTGAVMRKMPSKANAATVAGIINNSGLKAEEIKWSGIMPWLEVQREPIEKGKVLEYLRTDGAVQLQEVSTQDTIDHKSVAQKAGYRVEYVPRGATWKLYDPEDELVTHPDGRPMTFEWSQNEDDIWKFAYSKMIGSPGISNAVQTKFSQYQLPGGPLSRDTEILTRKGWRRIDLVEIGELALTRKDEGGELEWQPVEAKPSVYAEWLYHFKNQSVDMQVTACHKMVVKRRRRSSGETFRITAENLWKASECLIPLTGAYTQEQGAKLFGFDACDVAEFFGWYLAEGSCVTEDGKKSTIGISQSRTANPAKCERLEALFERMGVKWSHVPSGPTYFVGIRSLPKDFVKEIHAIGKSGDKAIPQWLMECGTQALMPLYEALLLGDGHLTKQQGRKPSEIFFSKSKELADQFQILATLLGKRACVRRRKTGIYTVRVGSKQWASVDDAKLGKVAYNDTAFCVTVENHAILVRRNGIAAFTGNSNYREVVLAMPGVENLPQKFKDEMKEKYGDDFYQRMNKDEEIKLANFISSSKSYTSSHFPDVPNYVAHARMNDRVDADGAEGLLLEEIQSDRHQQARKQGYAVPKGVKPTQAQAKEVFGISDESWAKMTNEDKDSYVNEIMEGGSHLKGGIADAPFRSSWPLQMFKRALRDAVDSGKEWIGWTDGDTQAQRYSLIQQVDSIQHSQLEGYPQGSKQLDVNYKDKPAARFAVSPTGNVISGWGNTSGLDGKTLSDIIGMPLAQRVLNSPDGSIANEQLDVGGEGMKGFYDEILPKEVQKYVKQWNAKVEKGVVNNPDKERRKIGGIASNGQSFWVSTTGSPLGGEKISEEFVTREQAEAHRAALINGATPIWRVSITPEMSESVMLGQALFGAPAAPGRLDKKTINKLDSEPTVKRYRAMAMIDGKLYPPMSTQLEGKLRPSEPIGEWMRSEERPELVPATGRNAGKFKLKGPNGDDVWALYAPYFHSSQNPLNDQFSAAYRKPLVTVEIEIPAKDDYQAPMSKRAVGEHPWGKGRMVNLSRYAKITRVVPDNEVARLIRAVLPKGRPVPDNVVTPSLRRELEKVGVPIEISGIVPSLAAAPAERASAESIQARFPNHRFVKAGEPTRFTTGEPVILEMYHATRRPKQLMKSGAFNPKFLGETFGVVNDRLGWYFSSEYHIGDDGEYVGRSGEVLPFYLRMDNPLVVDTDKISFIESAKGTREVEALLEAGKHDGTIAVMTATTSLGGNTPRPNIKKRYDAAVRFTDDLYRNLSIEEQDAVEAADQILNDWMSGKARPESGGAIINKARAAVELISKVDPEFENALSFEPYGKQLKEADNGGLAASRWWAIIPADNVGQIKSADPVTYDKKGNPIPLSERFNPESNSILYGAPASPDTDAALESYRNRSYLGQIESELRELDPEWNRKVDVNPDTAEMEWVGAELPSIEVQRLISEFNQIVARVGPLPRSGYFQPTELLPAPAAQLRLNAAPASPEQNTEAFQNALSQMPPMWANVLQQSIRGESIPSMARRIDISEAAVANILRNAQDRMTALMKAADGTLKAQMRLEDGVMKYTGGRPDLAFGATPNYNAVDRERATPLLVTRSEMNEYANRLFEINPEQAERLVTHYLDTQNINDIGMDAGIQKLVADASGRDAKLMLMDAAAQLLITRKSLAGNDPVQIARLIRLIDSRRSARTDLARALGMGVDPHMTPAERHAMVISSALLSPPKSIQLEIDKNPANKDMLLSRWAARSQKIKQDLIARGIDIDATFKHFNEQWQAARDTMPEQFREPLSREQRPDQVLVRTLMEGATPRQAAQAAGITLDDARTRYRSLRSRIGNALAAIKRGMNPAAPAGPETTLPDESVFDNPDQPAVANAQTRRLAELRKRPLPANAIDLNSEIDTAAKIQTIGSEKSTVLEYLTEFRRASILTGPQTHAVNVVSSFTYGAYEATVKKLGTAAVADLGRLFGFSPNAASLADLPAVLAAVVPSLQSAFSDAIRAWKSNTRVFEAHAKAESVFDNEQRDFDAPAMGGIVGKVMNFFSFRAMMLADQFILSLFSRLEVAAQAHQIARSENLSGQQMASRIKELMVPGSEAWLKGLEHGQKITFQTKIGSQARAVDALDGVAKALTQANQGNYGKFVGAISNLVFPFVSTPTNIFKQGMTMAPTGLFLGLLDAARSLNQRRKGNTQEAANLYNAARALDDLINQTVAWGSMFAVYSLIAPDEDDPNALPFLTGTLPWRATSKGERDIAYRTAPPQSVRIGGQWFSYKRLDPFATALAFVVDTLSEVRRGNNAWEALPKVGVNILNNFQDKTFMTGLSDVMNAIQDPDRYGTKWAINVVTGFVPNLIRQPLRNQDENFRQTDLPNDMGFLESVGKTLGASIYAPAFMPPKVDIWGREVVKNTGTGSPETDILYRILTPIETQDSDAPDPLDVALLRWNINNPEDAFSVVPPTRELKRTIGGKPLQVSLQDAEYNRMLEGAGKKARAAIGDRYNGRDLTIDDIDTIKKVLQSYQSQERERAFRENYQPPQSQE
jgi:hypothetical protein